MISLRSFLVFIASSFFLFSTLCYSENTPWVKVNNKDERPYFGNLTSDQVELLVHAVDQSLTYLYRPSANFFFPKQDMSQQRTIQSLTRFKAILQSGFLGDRLDKVINEEFDLYCSVGKEDKGSVLFTGYYEPIYLGSLSKTKDYPYPLYKKPADLLINKKGKIVGRKIDGRIVPYWNRKEIDVDGKLQGKNLELVYLKDPYSVYMVHLQGSAMINLKEGGMMRVGYAACNVTYSGFSLAKELAKEERFTREDLLPKNIAKYFREHPEELITYLSRNPSYVFFQKRKKGLLGALAVPLTQKYSLSLDKKLFPLGCLCFVDLKLYRGKKDDVPEYLTMTQFALNQDTGGAIKGAGRCDIFFGSGSSAREEANDMCTYGKLYFLFLKD